MLEHRVHMVCKLPVVGADKGVAQHLGHGFRVGADDIAHGGDLHFCGAVVDSLCMDAHHMAAADEA